MTSAADAMPTVEPPTPSVAIVGGGIMGLTVAYFLARRGITCDVFEASPVVGGLAGPLVLQDGTAVDRYYHAILSTDTHLRGLCEELGVADQLRFSTTRSAFFVDGGLHSMNSLAEFLLFKPLAPLDRILLGLTVARAQFYRDWQALEQVELRDWLVRLGGRRVFDKLWGPMLAAKFDGAQDGIRATWMWARLVRMKSTREGANQREQSGYLIGGYQTLLRAMVREIERTGGRVHLSTPVQQVSVDGGRATGVVIAGAPREYAQVVVTMPCPVAGRLLVGAPEAYVDRLNAVRYLGIVCSLLVLDRPLSGTWVVNIADPSVPLTGVIETTAYIDPEHVGGHHLVYLPRYTAPDSHWLTLPDEEIRRIWLDAVQRMFPAFDPRSVQYFRVHREKYVEPLHPIGAQPMPAIETPVPGLFLATTAQIYPALTNGESVTRHAVKTADTILASRERPS